MPSFSPGDVILVSWPFTDGSDSKVRPAVIAAVVLNDLGSQDVVICAVSSVNGITGIEVRESHADFARSGLLVASRILPKKIHTIAKSLVKRQLGSLSPALLGEVRADIKQILCQ